MLRRAPLTLARRCCSRGTAQRVTARPSHWSEAACSRSASASTAAAASAPLARDLRRRCASTESASVLLDDPTLPYAQRNVVDVLRERGLLDACTNESALRAAAASPASAPLRVYCGFDPTADSLHAGNLLGIIVLAWFQRCGHTPVALVGGATGRVGDPSGKSSERPILDDQTLATNVAGIAGLLKALLPAGGGEGGGGGGSEPLVLNNMDWFGQLSFLDFLREVGRHARVGVMLSKDSVKARMTASAAPGEAPGEAEGMSFTEFSYQLLQAHDFSHLFSSHGVSVQVGGSDQWGNITAGTDLIRRVHPAASAATPAVGLTFPLLLRSDGKKFGKSEDGAVWLTASKLSPYHFYQHWLRIPDADAPLFLRRLTFLPLSVLLELEGRAARGELRSPNEPQLLLAAELTRFVHGKEGLAVALRATEGLAPGGGGGGALDLAALQMLLQEGGAPAFEVGYGEAFEGEGGGMSVVELLVATGLQPSKAAAKRLVKGGGVSLNNVKVEDEGARLSAQDALGGELMLLAAGKKNKCVVRVCAK